MAKQRVQKRLAAILAADVVGYSRLIESDEESTITPPNMFENLRLTWNLGIPWEGSDTECLAGGNPPPVCDACGNPVIRALTR